MFRILLILLLIVPRQTATNLRILVREDADRAIAGLTLLLRTDDGQTRTIRTVATGVAEITDLSRTAVVLIGATLANGQALTVNPLRLVLIPGQTRDVLLRVDGNQLIADPDMIFSPNEPGEPTVAALPTLAALAQQAAVTAEPSAPTVVPPTAASTAPSGFPWACLLVLGLVLVVGGLAFGIGRLRQRKGI